MSQIDRLNDLPAISLDLGILPERRRTRRASRSPTQDLDRAAAAVRELLLALGEDPDRDGLRDTPRRVARSLAEQTAGLRESAAPHLGRVFQADYDGIVVVRDIPFASLCEHHLLPFTGHATIAYLPSRGAVVGLSKLARLVSVYARRPQVQERLTAQITDALEQHLAPRGCVVRLEAEHQCMRVRGVRTPGATTVTVLRRGIYAERPGDHPELADLLRGVTGSGHR